jgi:8-oxo-dGTP pyrophosphatase MutT (NUDIX family)
VSAVSFDSLLPLYRELATVVQRGGRIYPAALERHRGSPVGLAESAGHRLWVETALRAAGQRHLREVASLSPDMHDGRVLACVAADGFPIVCATGGYFDAIATSESLRSEYLDRVGRKAGSRIGLDDLPLRRLAHEASTGDALHSGRGRVAAVGVSVAVTVPGASGRALVLGLRSQRVATDPGMWHVAPSGTLEPNGVDPVIEVVERELSEELGVRIGLGEPLTGRLKPLGIGFDLLRLRPDICLQLDLVEQEIPRQGLALGQAEFQDQCLVELSSSSMSEFWASHPPETLTPAGTAAIALLEAAEGVTSP